MLRQRIITALVLIPPLIAALFFLPSSGVALMFGLFVGAAGWEWAGLCQWTRAGRIAYVATVLGMGGVFVVAALASPFAALAIFVVGTLWWVLAPFMALRATASLLHTVSGRALAGLLTLLPAWAALSVMHAADPQRPLLLLFVIVLVAVADTAAYAAGYAFGRTKLAPTISPGKTVEGVLGGFAAVVLLAGICGTMFWDLRGIYLGEWIALSAIAGLISVIGDLTESKMKRIAGVKDSGTLLPGHGGVLDRIDALSAATPVFALGWLSLFYAYP
jgi:phosphatidate cytidylyltransferase